MRLDWRRTFGTFSAPSRPPAGAGALCFACGLALLLAACRPPVAPQSVSGTIEIDEVHVAPRFGGRVTKTLASEGDSLKMGQPLLELDAPELRARRDAAKDQLKDLEAGPRAEELAEARQEWEAQTADLDQARTDAKRAEELFAKSTISATEREQATTRLAGLEKKTAAAKSRYELLQAGTRPDRISQARAQLAELDAELREMTLFAPTDSVLEVLSVKPGDVLAPNQAGATLLLTNHLWVRVYVPEPWLGRIQLGEAVQVRVDSEPDHAFSGTVEQLARAAEFTPRNVQTVDERVKQVFGVKVRLSNPEGKLRAGMSADVYFPGLSREAH